MEVYNNDEKVKTIIDQLINGFFLGNNGDFTNIHNSLLHHNDEFFVLKDFSSYVIAQQKASRLYENKSKWLKMSGINIAHSGMFSSDRTISEYAKDIWKV